VQRATRKKYDAPVTTRQCVAFTTTQGLEDQLLGDVVRKERPELEELKDRLVVSISNDKRQLAELEDKVSLDRVT
jgi:hypothetical protein